MRTRQLTRLLGGLLVLLALALAAPAWYWQQSHNQAVAEQAFAELMTEMEGHLQERLRMYEYGLRGLRGLVLAAGEREADAGLLHIYSDSRDFTAEFPGARGLSVAWRIGADEEPAYVQRTRRQGLPDFAVRQEAAHGGDRWVLRHIEPASRDQRALGLDLASVPRRRQAIDSAITTGEATLSEPLPLVTADEPRATLLMLPVYRREPGQSLDDEVSRRHAAIGVVYAPLVMREVLATRDLTGDPRLRLQIRDIQAADRTELLADPGFVEDPRLPRHRHSVTLYGRHWELDAQATDTFMRPLGLRAPWQTALVSSGIGLLLAMMVYLQREDRRRANVMALERTRRAAIVESSEDAVIAETIDGTIIEWNRAAERLFGYTAQQALGRTTAELILPPEHAADYHAHRDQVMRGERTPTFETQRRHADGTLIDVSIAASPILDARGRCRGYAKTVRDVRETKRAQAALAALNATLEQQVAERTATLESARHTLRAVLDAMPSLIGYWDRGLRNRVANHAYLDWFGMRPEEAEDRPMREVVGADLFDACSEHLAGALRGEPQRFLTPPVPRPDGLGMRHGQVSFVPDIVNGEVVGLFTLVHDISELVDSRARLAKAQRDNAALLETLHRHAIVSVAGRDGRIIEVNDAFCRISGYRREELIGQDHHVVNSGTHGKAFWQEMWHTVGQGQPWRGEVCNRAKDGSLYWVDSVIAPFRDAEGRIERYVSIRTDITPRVRAQAAAERAIQEAEASHSFLREVTDRLQMRIAYLDTQLRYRFANNVQCESLGAPREAIIGHTRLEITGRQLPFEVTEQLHAALTGESRQFEYDESEGPSPGTFEVRIVPHRDNTGRVIGLFAVSTEVTEQRRQDIERRRTLALLHSVLDASIQFSIIATDQTGTITVFNRGAERLLGYRADEVVGRGHALDFHEAQELCDHAARMQRELGEVVGFNDALSHPSQLDTAREWHYIRKNGQPVPVSLVVSAMHDDQGQLLGYLGVAHDVSERRAQERSLRAAVAAADAANQAKSQFLANMSHEIRTPMNAVIGLAYVLAQGQLAPEQAAILTKIQLASRQLLDIINDVLDLSKIEAGEMHLEHTAFEPARLVDELCQLMSVQAEVKGIRLEQQARDLPPVLLGDPTRLRQILVNLVGNAIKFTERGFVRLQVQAHAGAGDHCRLTVAVEDSGIGISAAAQQRLFDPFVQADSSTTRRYGGTGLGLSIVRQLVALMGGEVTVHSEEGRGSRFSFTLSLATGSHAQLEAPIATGLRDMPLCDVRLLAVDDNPMNLEVARSVLSAEGAAVEVANNGQEALERLRDGPQDIDLVLMDVQMPVLDGCEATRQIRQLPHGAELPIIGLSAGVSGAESQRVREAGMDDLVGKPFDPPMLVRRIEHWLRRRHRLTTDLGPPDEAPVPSPADQRATEPAPPPDWPAIDGIDGAVAQRQLGGNLGLLRDLLARLTSRFIDLPGCPLSEQAARLHDLKGSAGTVGARQLAHEAAAAEAACRQGEDVGPRLKRLADQLERLAHATSAAGLWPAPAMPTAPTTGAQPASGAPPLDQARLQDLVQRLEAFDLSAAEHLTALLPALRPHLGEAASEELRQLVDGLDYPSALLRLQALTPTGAMP